MIHLVLCDDEPAVLERCSAQLEAICHARSIAFKLDRFSSAEQLLFALEERTFSPDLIYLDVQMGGMDGVEAAKRLRALGSGAQLVFLSNAREAVFESFASAPLYYLLKDELTDEKFEQVFALAVERIQKEMGERFLCERAGERLALSMRQISYFEVRKRIITVHYNEGEFDFYQSIQTLEEQLLSHGFVRCHRAFLVNVAHIRRLDAEQIQLIGGGSIPLGRTYSKQIREALSRFLTDAEEGMRR